MVSLTQVAVAAPVGPPSLRCASVSSSGDVTLSWVAPADPDGDFVSYHIFHSSTGAAGSYTAVGIVPVYSITTFSHSVSAAVASQYYYIITEYTDPSGTSVSLPSDTLRTMKLTVGNPGNGTAVLTWNPMHVPPLKTSYPSYNIFLQATAGGAFTFIGTTSSTRFVDTVDYCNRFLSYRVELNDSSGCTSSSDVQGQTFTDMIGPYAPLIDSVSIDVNTGKPIIGWNPSVSPDVQKYYVYVLTTQNPPWVKIDEVAGGTTSSSISSWICNSTYSVAAVDSCNLVSLIAPGHKTICLTSSFESCSRSVNLSWTSYVNWPNGVSGYEIWYSTGFGSFEYLTTTADTFYRHTALTGFTDYCYFVRAREKNSTRSSSSNKTCFFTAIPVPPSFSYLKYATVEGNTVKLQAYIDNSTGTSEFVILRSFSDSVPADTVAVLNRSDVTGDLLSHTDTSSALNTSLYSYTYTISAVDSCGNTMVSTNPGKTILLTGLNESLTFSNSLSWTQYLRWENGIGKINLVRRNAAGVETIIELPAGQVRYSDEIFNDFSAGGDFCYYIEAEEAAGGDFNFGSVSRSNEVCLVQPPVMYIPNAFSPGGINRIFKPQGAFIDPEGYVFRIFSRHGEIIFHTNDVDQGWNGIMSDGQIAPAGLYVYRLTYRSSAGEVTTTTGSFYLL